MSRKQRNTIIFSVLLGVSLTILGLGKYLSSASGFQEPTEVGSLNWLAQDAQAQGLQEVNLPTFEWHYASVGNIDEALARYTVVVAQPSSRRSYDWSSDHQVIGTWYKFTVTETLSQKPFPTCARCAPSPDPPADMLPLTAGELLLPKMGGSLNINGVIINSSDADFPDYAISQGYLLFLDVDSTKGVGFVAAGPVAAFVVDGNGNLTPVTSLPNPLAAGMASRYGNSLNALRNSLGG